MLDIVKTHTDDFKAIIAGQNNIEQKIKDVETSVKSQNEDILSNKKDKEQNKNQIRNTRKTSRMKKFLPHSAPTDQLNSVHLSLS